METLLFWKHMYYGALLLKVASDKKTSNICSPGSILEMPSLKPNTCLTEPKSEFQ